MINIEEQKEVVKRQKICEWIKINSNEYACYTHSESYDSRVMDWKLCPYCSKKISIKER